MYHHKEQIDIGKCSVLLRLGCGIVRPQHCNAVVVLTSMEMINVSDKNCKSSERALKLTGKTTLSYRKFATQDSVVGEGPNVLIRLSRYYGDKHG
jgi:hypothetical protein